MLLGNDTDHCVRLSVKLYGAAQHRPIRTEMILPEWVAEHGDGVVSRLTFAILIDATQQRVGTQCPEKAGRGQCRLYMECFPCSSQTHGSVGANGQVCKRAALLFPVLVICQGNLLIIAAAATVLFRHDDHAAQVWHRERTQYHGIHHAEDRRVHANPNRQRERRREREPGRLRQLANGVAQIGPQNLEEGKSPLHAISFPGLGHTTEGAQRGCPCVLFRHPSLHVFFHGELDVATQLLVEIFIKALSAE